MKNRKKGVFCILNSFESWLSLFLELATYFINPNQSIDSHKNFKCGKMRWWKKNLYEKSGLMMKLLTPFIWFLKVFLSSWLFLSFFCVRSLLLPLLYLADILLYLATRSWTKVRVSFPIYYSIFCETRQSLNLQLTNYVIMISIVINYLKLEKLCWLKRNTHIEKKKKKKRWKK